MADHPPPGPRREENVDELEWNDVTPAKAGVQRQGIIETAVIPPLDPGFRRDSVQQETRSSRISTVPEGEGARQGLQTRGVTAIVVLILALGLAACAPRPAALPLDDATAALDAAALYESLREREDRMQTLRARFSATVHSGDSQRRAEGVLLVKKPQQFRLRLLSPFGFTVFDYAAQGAHARMQLPLEGKELVDTEIDTQSGFSPIDFRRAFLRGDEAFPGSCDLHSDTVEVVVTCRAEDGLWWREIRIARATATVTRESTFAGEQLHSVMQFGDYRLVDGMAVPFAIELRTPPRSVTVQIVVRAYEVNPTLTDALFDAATGGGG